MRLCAIPMILGVATRLGVASAFLPRSTFVKHAAIRRFMASSVDAAEGAAVADAAVFTELSRLEIRVGRIVDVSTHPTLEKIFVEKIDLGEEEPRIICSGLQGYLTEDDLMDKDCVVVCNLKPRDLEGVPSNGMVLCASNKEHTEVKLVVPPAGVPAGELITFAGHTSEPAAAGNRAVKAGKKAGGSFATDENGKAMFVGEPSAPFQTSLGICTSTIKGGSIS